VRRTLAIAASVTLLASAAGAYTSFGKNKVQYYKHDWQIIKSDHVDLYFYSAERELAERAVVLAEEAWDELSLRLAYMPRHRVPLIIYSSHSEFQETNVLPYILPEGVAGFTELLKHRVVVPFDGSYPRFRRVIRHEMTHFFMYEKLRDIYSRHNRYDYGQPPFWYIEGLAEYMSTDWDGFSDAYLADALYSDALVPLAKWRYIAGTYLGYKEGESALHYVAENYGEDKIVKMTDYAWLTRDYDGVIDLVLSVPFEQFDEDWQRWVRRRYWPRYAEHDELDGLGDMLTKGGGLRSGVAWLDENRLVYLSSEEGRPTLYLMTLDGEGRAESRKLLEGGKSGSYTVMHVYRERVGTHGGRLVAFAARAGARDRLYVFDVTRDEVVQSFEFDDLILLGSPSFSPDGERIVFRGLARSGRADLYVVTRATGERTALTDDLADDVYPCWTEGGIVFASEKDAATAKDNYNLYLVDPSTGETNRLTRGPWRDLYPAAAPDGSLYFISDRAGRYDAYRLDPDGVATRMSKSLTAVTEAAPRPDGEPGEVALIGLAGQSFNVYRATLGGVKEGEEAVPEIAATTEPPAALPVESFTVHGYKTRFALDYFSGQIAYGPEFGTETGIILTFTDILNDESIQVLFGNDATTVDEFLKRTSIGVDYYNLRHRIGYGYGVFHYVKDYYDYLYGISGRYYSETRGGAGGTVTYPLDRFHRVGGSLYLYELKREWEIETPTEYGTKVSPYLSAARDTSLWYRDGPIDGQRLNLTAGVTQDLRRRRVDYVYLSADLRHYLRTTLTQCFAFRLAAVGTFGPDARPLYSGGSLSMRGYNWFDFRGRHFAMANAEYRFPVLEPFGLRTAVGTAPMPPVRGALFFDAGEGWDGKLGRVRGDFGLGVRVILWGFLVLRTDHAVLTDFESLGPFVPIKFFVGWSY
jgi:hypothetical protein